MHDLAFYVYLITNKRNGTLYLGHTDDLNLRMEQHITGAFEGFSKRNGLKHLVWFETHETRDYAFTRERQLKSWKRDWKLDLIEKQNPHWIDIYRSPQWPVPNEKEYPNLYAQCLDCRIDPSYLVKGK